MSDLLLFITESNFDAQLKIIIICLVINQAISWKLLLPRHIFKLEKSKAISTLEKHEMRFNKKIEDHQDHLDILDKEITELKYLNKELAKVNQESNRNLLVELQKFRNDMTRLNIDFLDRVSKIDSKINTIEGRLDG